MKKLIFAVIVALFAACTTDTTKDIAVEIPETLTVTFEDDTRIQLNEEQKTVWTAGDCLSVFYLSNANQKWQYQGETGERTGILRRISTPEATQEMTCVVAVYPYNEDYYINPRTFNVKAFLPAEQSYLKDSYGLNGNIMVSQSEYNQLSLRNVCGWIKIRLTGNGQIIKKITLKGNNGEQVAGEIYIDTAKATATLASEMGSEADDAVGGALVFDDTILTEVSLVCPDGVILSEEPTAFYIALPPQTFSKGVSVEVECKYSDTIKKSTNNSITITRNTIQPMDSADIDYGATPTNQIRYTSTDGNIVTPYKTDVFGGANIVSNTYENGQGIITFDAPVTSIGGYAFYYCSSLTSVTIPDSVTSIGNYAFLGCSSLTEVTIPDSVTSIGNSAFYKCSSLAEFNGKFASADKRCLIVDGVLNSFAPAGLAEYTIPDSVTSIGNNAFYKCSNLTNITIPDSVTSIGYAAFSGCSSLTSIVIPNSVTSIGGYVFSGCSSLAEFNGKFASSDKRCLIVDGVLNSFAPAGLVEYTIPNSVTSIGYYAFDSCSSLTSVTIPDSVTAIEAYAFEDCSSLKDVYCKPATPPTLGGKVFTYIENGEHKNLDCTIYVPTISLIRYKSAKKWIEYSDNIKSAELGNNQILYTAESQVTPYATDVFGANIVSHIFDEESGVGLITFDANVTKIGERAFNECNTITGINIPNSVTEIGIRAFRGCTAITSIVIPDSVTSIGFRAFYGCDSLTTVTIPDSVTTLGVNPFENCDKLAEFNGKFASADKCCLIVDGVLNSFAPAAGLTEYTIPDNITSIGDYALWKSGLTSITIPNSVTSIGNGAFGYCLNLTSVTIPDSVTSIGEMAFYSCSSLASVYCKPTTPPTADKGNYSSWDAFYDNASGRKIYVPRASESAYEAASYWSDYASDIEPYDFN